VERRALDTGGGVIESPSRFRANPPRDLGMPQYGHFIARIRPLGLGLSSGKPSSLVYKTLQNKYEIRQSQAKSSPLL
jgi:hypothetical protein